MDKGFVLKTRANIISGLINKLIVLLCPFFLKQIVLRSLGVDFLGLDSLFVSILSVLNVTEMGFGVAILSNMYEPFLKGNVSHLSVLLLYYKKVYRIIGCAIIIAGCCLIPFLPKMIKGDYPSEISLYLVYIIFVVNAALNYFLFSYLESLIIIAQRDDIKFSINSIMVLGQSTAQIIVLYMFANYYIYILMMPVFTVLSNIRIYFVVNKLFPDYCSKGDLDKKEKQEIKIKTIGSFITKTCQLSRNSFDCICISAFLGLGMAARYSNYYYIMMAMVSSLGIITQSIRGGVGKHVYSDCVESNYIEFKKIDFYYMLLAGWFVIIFLCVVQPFMLVWMGEDMLLPFPVVILFALYFYLLKIGDIPSMYSQVKGLFWKHKYRALVETFSNLVLNILLGRAYGIYGIVVATIFTLFFCGLIWGNSIIFRNYFGVSRIGEYYGLHLVYLIITMMGAVLFYYLCTLLPFEGIRNLAARTTVCVGVPALFILIYAYIRRKKGNQCRK